MSHDEKVYRLVIAAKRHMDVPAPSWLRCLITEFEVMRPFFKDEDPAATDEMLVECKALADAVERFAEPVVPVEATHDDADIPF